MNNTVPIPWWRVDFMEDAARAAYNAVMNRHMTMGPLTREFEAKMEKLLDVPHVVATASGTAALSLALLEAGIGPGDEVIVPNRSWIATAHAPYLLGAKVVFADIEPDRPVLDPAAAEAAITARTRAIIAVHLNGWPCDMPRLSAIAQKHGLVIIEDACQALFSVSPQGGFLGAGDNCGCFSLSIGKMISSGQGGFVTTRDPEKARRLSIMRTQGASNIILARWEMAGGNFRFWDLPAAVALTQLERKDEKIAKVIEVYKFYEQLLAGHPKVELIKRDISSGQLPLYVDCFCRGRAALLAHTEARGIQCRPYYANMNRAAHFEDAGDARFPNSIRYERAGLVLPCGPDRTAEELEAVADALRDFQ